MPAAERGDRCEVDELEQGVGRRFDEDHPGFRTDRSGDGRRISQIDVAEAEASALPAHLVHQPEGATIEVVAGDDVRTDVDEFKDRGNGGHARGEGVALRATLKIGDAAF